jgi:3-hydroxyacyl-CoA dehydrogenase, C-terminal domain
VFNPVTKMRLVELVLPAAASEETRERALALRNVQKTPVEVPDIPGFVVSRPLFPYLFSAVRLLQDTDLDAASVDTCMRLGAGHPMGPLAPLDLVGLDVAKAIGETIGEPGARSRRQDHPQQQPQPLGGPAPAATERPFRRRRQALSSLRGLLAGVDQGGHTWWCDSSRNAHPPPPSAHVPVRSPRGPDVFLGSFRGRCGSGGRQDTFRTRPER